MWFEGYAWREYVSSRSRSGDLIDTAEKNDRLESFSARSVATISYRLGKRGSMIHWGS